jgi:hypothetical protein
VVTYSSWRPDGGYDYYDVSTEIAALGNDLPVPRLSSVGPIGVPSIEAGRPIPTGARHAGSGERAVGLVAPMNSARLGMAIGQEAIDSRWLWFGAGFTLAAALWFVTRLVEDKRRA